MPAVRRGTTSMKFTSVAAAAVILSAVAACSSQTSPAPSTSAASPTSTAASTSASTAEKSVYPAKSYDLGHSVVYRQAFLQFTGTGTPWDKACGSVVDEWQSSVGTQAWWNRDEVMRGCLESGGGASASAAKECAPQDGKQIKIYGGDISCEGAYVITGRYDFNKGPKYQQIDSIDTWTCYTSIADLRPIILTCVSDKDVEFNVSEVS